MRFVSSITTTATCSLQIVTFLLFWSSSAMKIFFFQNNGFLSSKNRGKVLSKGSSRIGVWDCLDPLIAQGRYQCPSWLQKKKREISYIAWRDYLFYRYWYKECLPQLTSSSPRGHSHFPLHTREDEIQAPPEHSNSSRLHFPRFAKIDREK
jgi:hypothetical protein